MIHNRITTALLLAAGTGSRLHPLTLDAPKCLTEVGGEPMLGRLVGNLRLQGIKRLVVVTGYLDHRIREFLQNNAADLQVDYVFNPVYKTTNNIYSLWLAREIIDEPFILIESDLVFEESLLEAMLTPDKIAISNILPWMNGTVVEINNEEAVTAFHVGHNVNDALLYKTVNIYSLSLQSWHRAIERLDRFIADGRVGEYYEIVFADMVADSTIVFDAVFFDENKWYEIDTMLDLQQAELMFPSTSLVASAVCRLGPLQNIRVSENNSMAVPSHYSGKNSNSPAEDVKTVVPLNKRLASDTVPLS
ncbi:MAG: phosphocholine cytidylyltransferase family protein [Gammaproteobacteria bacterium]|nr:MAG: phosphocholine cytidylyltransferase family protein [Gammaproteobacteria bacterium]